jgi:hypothetical protein
MFIVYSLEVSNGAVPSLWDCFARMIDEMEDSSILWFSGLRGGVEDEWAHQESIAFFGDAGDFSVKRDLTGDRVGLKDSSKVRS